jgi:multicomponent Na+:H+ antiporter subunit D
MSGLVLLPVLAPFLAAVAAILVRRRPAFQRTLGLVGALGGLGAALALLGVVWRDGMQVLRLGDWPAPYGIILVADLFSAVMATLAGVTGVLVLLYSTVTIDHRREAFGYYPLMLLLLMGVNGAFLTGDLFNLYVWFEVLLMASFVLLTLGGERGHIAGGFKYVTLNLLASTLFLTGLGLMYGMTGSLNLAALAQSLRSAPYPGLIMTVSMLFLLAFGIKAAVFPLFFWLPASYHTPPVAVSALFVGLLTKVGVYALVRVFTLLFVQDAAFTHTLILVIAGLTMISGALGALAHTDLRRILSFLVISHIGFALMGLGFYMQRGLAGTVFYIVEDMLVFPALFMASGLMQRLGGSFEIGRLGGLYRTQPFVATLFLIPALSTAGVPPLSGFFAKLALIEAGLESGQFIIIGAALLTSLLSLVIVTRIWSEAFWREAPAAEGGPAAAGPRRLPGAAVGPVAVLALLLVLIGLGAGGVYAIAEQAAGQLLDPARYISVVLGN